MAAQITEITGIGSTTVHTLNKHGFKTVKSIADATIDKLSGVHGFSAVRAQKTIDAAKQLLNSTASKPDTVASVKKSPTKKEASKNQKSKDKKDKKDKKLKNKKKSDKNKSRDKKKNKKKNRKK